MSFIIYHNNRCSKSRGALALLKERGIMPDIHYYLEKAPSPDEIRVLLHKLKMKAEDLVRKSESVYKENYKGQSFSEEEWIRILSENPVLIERPIIVHGDKAVIGRPPEKVLELLPN